MTVHVSVLYVIFLVCAAYWIGYFAHWFLSKRVGIIHIEKDDKSDYDQFAIEFTTDLNYLYSQREVMLKVHVTERKENSADSDNT